MEEALLYQKRRSYIKVPEKIKRRLFKMVTLQGKKIRKAAQLLNIKYITAKTIIYYKKKQFRQQCPNLGATKVCNYAIRPNLGNLKVITKIGGFTIGE